MRAEQAKCRKKFRPNRKNPPVGVLEQKGLACRSLANKIGAKECESDELNEK